jgi:phosphatidylethanolamine-binding protein (PEBP) family uncharacterized protein
MAKKGTAGRIPSSYYCFNSYALSIAKRDLDEKTPPAMVGFDLDSHTIAKASLIAYYQR